MNLILSISAKFGTIIKALKAAIYGLFIFLGIPMDLVHTLSILMGVDTTLGIAKALKLGEKVSFKILLWGMITKVAVLIIPMVLALIAKGLGFDFIWFIMTVMNVLIVSEGFSCITNILSIKTGQKIENTDYVTGLLKAIRKGLAGIIKRLLDKIESGQNEVQDK